MVKQFPISESERDMQKSVSEAAMRNMRERYGAAFAVYFPAAKIVPFNGVLGESGLSADVGQA